MNKCKKLWTVFLAALMAALAGCGDSQSSADSVTYQPPPREVIIQHQDSSAGMMEAPTRSRDRTPDRTANFTQQAPRTCPACGGQGYVICYTCNGKGRVRCDDCRGTGVDATGRRCIACGGSGSHGCTTCGIIMGTSRGRLQCNRCNGRGTITP